MNELGILLVGSIVRCTLVAALGVLLVVALRRQGPATGATIAATTLLVLIGVSGLAIAPWPRWWTVGSGEEGVRTPRSSSPKAPATSGAPRAMPPPHVGPVVLGPEAAPGPEAESRGVASEIGRVLLSTPRVGERTTRRWTWLPYVAPAFVAGLVFGLARLLLGVRGVHTLRGRARPIDDAVLLEILASLCAAMGSRPAVALLESDEVASPATVGWQRPAVILPPDWREWDGQERRVVLAHELAHICRGDYPIALAAQLSLALHFYHPLVYWLAGRLRLEQELAADAWGAAVAGGNHRYLATLARIALRESERPASWPARAFFSNRRTLLRRIEMLRESNPIGRVAPSRPVRALMVTALLVAGLVVAGLRGPESPVPARAQTPARAQEKGPVIARPVPADFDLAYVPSDAVLVFAARPAEFLGLLGYEPLVKLLQGFDLVPAASFPVSPMQVEQVFSFVLGDDPAGAAVTRPRPGQRFAMVQRTNKPQDWAKAIVESVGEVEKVPFEGREYLRLKQPCGDYCAYTPDDRTLLTAGEDVLRDLIRRGPDLKAGHAWDPSWESVKRCQFAICGNQAGLRLWMGNPGLTALQVSAFSPFFEKTRTFALGIEAGQGVRLDGLATCASAADARQVGESCQAALTLARNLMRDLHAQAKPAEAMPRLFALNGLIDPLLNAARIDVRDQGERSLVRLTATTPDLDAGEVIKLFLPPFAPSRPPRDKNRVATATAGEECHFEVRNNRITFIDLARLYKLMRADALLRVRLAENTRVIESRVGPAGSFSMAYVLRKASTLGMEDLMGRRSYSFELRGWELVPEYDGRGELYETTRQPLSEFARVLNRYSAESTTITMWIYPDGFTLYRKLRDDLHARGYLVAARPLPEGMPIKGSPSGSVSVGQ